MREDAAPVQILARALDMSSKQALVPRPVMKTATTDAAHARKVAGHEAAAASQAKKPVSGAAAAASTIEPKPGQRSKRRTAQAPIANRQPAMHAMRMYKVREGGQKFQVKVA